jgi:DNA repair photolyase
MTRDAQEIVCKSVLTNTGGSLNSFTRGLNPHSGCAFGAEGCRVYCYVAESPAGRFAPGPWGSWVRVKMNAAGGRMRDFATATVFRRGPTGGSP